LKGEGAATRGAAAAASPTRRNAQRKTREHYDKAILVISGKVTSIRTPGETAGESGAPSESAPGGPVSEHDPEWREAVIEVSDVHKGSKKKRVVVRFPASTDVMWYGAPKFHPGQQGYFMLRKAEGRATKTKQPKKSRGAAGATAESKPVAKEVYTALDPADFQPYHEPGGIKSLIEAEPTEDEE
jgi:hypothetical protein